MNALIALLILGITLLDKKGKIDWTFPTSTVQKDAYVSMDMTVHTQDKLLVYLCSCVPSNLSFFMIIIK
jgi:hypothetical protein